MTHILMTTCGTYPFAKGGVSNWCHLLISQLPEIEFTLFALTANPYQPFGYKLSENVRQVIKIPLWGVEDPAEYSWRSPFSQVIRSKIDTTPSVVRDHFVPALEHFLEIALLSDRDRLVQDDGLIAQLGKSLLHLHHYFLRFDYRMTWQQETVWQCFSQYLRRYCEQEKFPLATIAETSQSLKLLAAFFQACNYPIPQTDVVHGSISDFSGLAGVLSKLQWGTPYLLTEHGIFVREQYLNLNPSTHSLVPRSFLFCIHEAVVRLNFFYADCVSPVCAYNARWERWWGVPQDKIQVVYNGVDHRKFYPTPPTPKDRLQVMSMGLIFPLKGQLHLLQAAAIVRREISNVEFRFYGKPSDQHYFELCKACIEENQLADNVTWAGFTSEPWRVYSEADVVAMSSISEGFPFAVVEAMLSGATLVATDVGGVREAIADTGIMVRAAQPQEMAEAILHLLGLPEEERRAYGRRALERALALFTQEKFLDEHRQLYQRLIHCRHGRTQPSLGAVDRTSAGASSPAPQSLAGHGDRGVPRLHG